MPAHFRKTIPQQCNHAPCARPATGILYNTRNEVIGPRCTQHGEADAHKLNQEGG